MAPPILRPSQRMGSEFPGSTPDLVRPRPGRASDNSPAKLHRSKERKSDWRGLRCRAPAGEVRARSSTCAAVSQRSAVACRQSSSANSSSGAEAFFRWSRLIVSGSTARSAPLGRRQFDPAGSLAAASRRDWRSARPVSAIVAIVFSFTAPHSRNQISCLNTTIQSSGQSLGKRRP